MMASVHTDESPIRVMLVDDSAIIRGLISRGLTRNPRIEIAATASDGEMALSVLKRNKVQVILLDVEMPNKDGLQALPELKKIAPDVHIIMVSSLTERNAKISLRALELGASDYVAKPSATGDNAVLVEFYRSLDEKVMALGMAFTPTVRPQAVPVAAVAPTPVAAPKPERTTAAPMRFASRKNVLAIASSTGGPQALLKLLTMVKDDLASVPVLITQHMPATFTALLAEHISNDTGLACFEGKQGEKVESGRVYIAPGGFHMMVEKDASGTLVIKLEDSAPVNFCKPAADPMFDSIAKYYGKNVLSLVLTGMGNDGCDGAKRIKDAGGALIVQDKESSVVWGMPGAIAAQGFQDEIATLERMAECIRQAVR
jgi:two-component system chemotaxis response regulator CheB